MAQRSNRRLLALNAALLAGLAVVALAPSAGARQPASAPTTGARARGQYTMVSGSVQGRNEAAVYVIDAGNMEMLALRYDTGRKELQVMSRRDIAADSGRPGQVKPR